MYTKFLISAAIGTALLSGPAYAADAENPAWMQEYLYFEYQKYPHAEPLPQSYVVSMAPKAPAATVSTQSYDRITEPKERMVNIGGQQLAESAVVGTPVVTPAGERLGHVSRVAGEGDKANEIVISLDDENQRIRSSSDEPAELSEKAASKPVIVGGPRVVVAADRMRHASDGSSLVIEQSSLRPIDRKYS